MTEPITPFLSRWPPSMVYPFMAQRTEEGADESGHKAALFGLDFLLTGLQGGMNLIFTGITEEIVTAIDFKTVNLVHRASAFGAAGSKCITDQIINHRVYDTVDRIRNIFAQRRHLNSE